MVKTGFDLETLQGAIMSRSFLRHRQPGLTRVFPHQANKRFIIPNRMPGPFPTLTDHKSGQILVIFNEEITGTDAGAGFTVEENGADLVIITATQTGINELTVSHAGSTVGEITKITYDGGGDWAGVNNESAVPPFTRQGVVT